MIVYLYSNKIPQSVEILKSLPQNILTFFRIINIDNKEIINTIKKSKTVKLKNVPTVFVIYKTFIDEVDINSLVHNLNIYIQPQNTKTFDVIDDDIINNIPQQPSLKKINKPLPPNQQPQRLKTHSLGGLSSLQPRPPVKGSGHKHMAMSSINDSLIANDDSQPDELPDNPLLDDNLKIPKNLNNEQKKELINNAMRQAEKEREEMIQSDESKQTGILPPKQNNNFFDSNDIIDDDFNINNTDNTNETINVEDYRT
jgi:hypothetical protein